MFYFKSIFVIITLVCLSIRNTNALFDGLPATRGQFPSHVAVFIRNQILCGGTIVNENHVITSTSCILNENNELHASVDVSLRAAVILLNVATPRTNVLALFPHPQFNPFTMENDISVLRTTSNFTFNMNFVMPPLLPTNLNQRIIADQTECNVVGWNPPTPALPNSPLLFRTVRLLNRNSVCNSHVHFNGIVRDMMVCAGNNLNFDGGLCPTSRGGGLYCNNILAGVVSFGFGCGNQPITPGVYTQVRIFHKWIIRQFNRTDIPRPGPTPPPSIRPPGSDGYILIANKAAYLVITVLTFLKLIL